MADVGVACCSDSWSPSRGFGRAVFREAPGSKQRTWPALLRQSDPCLGRRLAGTNGPLTDDGIGRDSRYRRPYLRTLNSALRTPRRFDRRFLTLPFANRKAAGSSSSDRSRSSRFWFGRMLITRGPGNGRIWIPASFDVPDDTWCTVNNALARGTRGLPGGTSLIKLLINERGEEPVFMLARSRCL